MTGLPCSPITAQFNALAYLSPNWKIWPTSIPRRICKVPCPSGLGSPATTLRISAISVMDASRSQLTPVVWKSGLLAPLTKSDNTAAARSTITGMFKSNTPIYPLCRPAACIASSLAMVSGALTCANFSALISFRVWSPRNTNATKVVLPSAVGSPSTIKVLTVCDNGKPKCSATCSQVGILGVLTSALSCVGAARSPTATASASSILAA